MLSAYRLTSGRLEKLAPGSALDDAVWIDLWRALPAQVAAVEALGVMVPSREDMEEIELSSRLYHEGGRDFMTVVMPGLTPDGEQVSGPVTFVLGPDRLVTVRHHAPRPFETFPSRAEKSPVGCGSTDRLFLGLLDEVVGRLADHLETAGHGLDEVTRAATDSKEAPTNEMLEAALSRVGIEGERISRVRLSLLTIQRMLGFHALQHGESKQDHTVKAMLKTLNRDVQALEVHADFLSARVGLATDTTLGMINLRQNATARTLSVVAVLFLPATLIASIFGMNFAVMPGLEEVWGYPAALVLMLGTAFGSWAFFKWRGWL